MSTKKIKIRKRTTDYGWSYWEVYKLNKTTKRYKRALVFCTIYGDAHEAGVVLKRRQGWYTENVPQDHNYSYDDIVEYESVMGLLYDLSKLFKKWGVTKIERLPDVED